MQDLFKSADGNPLFRQFKVSDLLFTEYKCLEEESVFDIWSQYNYFVYVLSGKKQWNTQQAEYMVYAEELIFVKKGANIIHKFFEEDFCALMIFVPDGFIREIVQGKPEALSTIQEQTTDSVLPLALDAALHAYFQSLYAYFYREEAPSVSLLEVKFKELLLNLLSSKKHRALRAYFKSIFYHTQPSIQAIMEANFSYKLSMDAFAKLCGRSLSTFKREFKAIYGCPPGRWLTQKRLEHAKKLLTTSDKKINELIFECGFENASHFSRAFKAKYGITPLQYRE